MVVALEKKIKSTVQTLSTIGLDAAATSSGSAKNQKDWQFLALSANFYTLRSLVELHEEAVFSSTVVGRTVSAVKDIVGGAANQIQNTTLNDIAGGGGGGAKPNASVAGAGAGGSRPSSMIGGVEQERSQENVENVVDRAFLV